MRRPGTWPAAANSVYIETLPRIGYRFIAPVEAVQRNGAGIREAPVQSAGNATRTTTAATTAEASARKSKFLSDPQELPPASRRLTHLLFSLIQVMYLGFYIAALTNLSRTQQGIGQLTFHVFPVFVILILSAASGIPVRLYLISAVAFRYQGLAQKFRRIFPGVFVLDEMWALVPLLLVQYIGLGLALCAVAALLYLPFAERSLLLMGTRSEIFGISDSA